jgi:environmental stress-induced protein Ves
VQDIGVDSLLRHVDIVLGGYGRAVNDELGVVRWGDLPPEPWANGGGTTRTVARFPDRGDGPSSWRVSIADIDTDGPFSTFPGLERTFVLIDGPGVRLTVDGVRHGLRRGDRLRFSGEQQTACRLDGGPARALNVMTRRDVVHADVELLHDATATGVEAAAGTTVLLLCLSGRTTVLAGPEEKLALGPLDAVRADRPGTCQLTVEGSAVVVRLVRRDHSGSSSGRRPDCGRRGLRPGHRRPGQQDDADQGDAQAQDADREAAPAPPE